MSIVFIAVLFFLSSCSMQDDRNSVNIPLTDKTISVSTDVSIFDIVHVSDTSVICHILYDSCLLCSFNTDVNESHHKFLHKGRGPLEVHYATIKGQHDSIYVMAHTGSGIQGMISIPINGHADKSEWKYKDLKILGNIPMGGDFDIKDNKCIILGEEYGNRTFCQK